MSKIADLVIFDLTTILSAVRHRLPLYRAIRDPEMINKRRRACPTDEAARSKQVYRAVQEPIIKPNDMLAQENSYEIC